MAHQAHNIPWSSLTSNLRWSSASRKVHNTTDFHLQDKPNQKNDLKYFAKKFVQNIEEHSKCERAKYPETYDPPDADEDIIGDTVAAKIFPTVRKWREDASSKAYFDCIQDAFCCKSSGDPPCCPVLPLHERKMSAFCREYQYSECFYFFRGQSSGYFNMELVKTLLLYGEMEPLLRACAHPDVTIGDWLSIDECGCNGNELGWDQIYKKALVSYIGLNVIYAFPETWDAASGRDHTRDYRNSRLYQNVASKFVGHYESPVVVYPHRQMLGIEPPRIDMDKQNTDPEWLHRFGRYTRDRGYLYILKKRAAQHGQITYDEFLKRGYMKQQDAPYDPDTNDIIEVQSILRSQGLPTELALEILEFADYSTSRGVKVPHDPFHPDNRERLEKYLSYCWQVIVRCNMLHKELGINPTGDADWEQIVIECIGCDLWSSTDTNRRNLIKYGSEEQSGEYRCLFR